jgi:hypothetical protein
LKLIVYLFLLVDVCLRYDCGGGTCTNDRGVARCICPTGRVGSHCQGSFIEIGETRSYLFFLFFFQDDICTIYPCANNGQCVPEGHSRRCICSSPYQGDDCREGKLNLL